MALVIFDSLSMNTILDYFENPFSYESHAKIVGIFAQDPGKDEMMVVLLDRTIFYPQGGGQPCDQGTIKNAENVFEVTEVRNIDGIVHHIGRFLHGTFQKDEEVIGTINKQRRIFHSTLHSAGHLIDYALDNIGYSWEPTKGYHFPDGPYVEYKGFIEENNREAIRIQLEQKINEFIQQGAEVSFKILNREELTKICHFVPDYLPKGRPIRVAIFDLSKEYGGKRGIPCGGTHVANLQEIGSILIPKIKVKNGIIRISYRCV